MWKARVLTEETKTGIGLRQRATTAACSAASLLVCFAMDRNSQGCASGLGSGTEPQPETGWGRAPKEMLHTRRLRADVLLKLDALVHVCRQIGMNLQMKLRFCCSICDV